MAHSHNTCPDCDGTKITRISCCGDDIDFGCEDMVQCPSCREWCTIDDCEPCESCDGTGIVNLQTEAA